MGVTDLQLTTGQQIHVSCSNCQRTINTSHANVTELTVEEMTEFQGIQDLVHYDTSQYGSLRCPCEVSHCCPLQSRARGGSERIYPLFSQRVATDPRIWTDQHSGCSQCE
jgi:hypothetical protein